AKPPPGPRGPDGRGLYGVAGRRAGFRGAEEHEHRRIGGRPGIVRIRLALVLDVARFAELVPAELTVPDDELAEPQGDVLDVAERERDEILVVVVALHLEILLVAAEHERRYPELATRAAPRDPVIPAQREFVVRLLVADADVQPVALAGNRQPAPEHLCPDAGIGAHAD